jgi:hypothetical protein
MRGIDEEPIGLAGFPGKDGKDAIEDAHPAPADEAVIERLMRAVFARRIAPAQAVFDDEDDAADNPVVIHPGHPVRARKIELDAIKLIRRQPEQIRHGTPPRQTLESDLETVGKSKFNRS